jgi:hypothetical protein
MGKEIKEISISITKSGLPALWEEGGSTRNMGEAIIIAGPRGEPLRPLYIKTGGPLACGQHALFVITPGYHVVSVSRWRYDYDIEVWRIIAIDVANHKAKIELVCEFSYGEWDHSPPKYLAAAIDAAKKKATCYHCRRPHYIKDPDP